MKIIILSICFLIFLLLLTGGVISALDNRTFVIGGEYIVPKGEIVQDNFELAFAQVTLEKDSLIKGDISSFSSTIDICGSVTGNISSIESDIELERTAKVKSLPQEKGVIAFVILLPKMARWNLSFGH
jgi:hypothetical protein